MGVHPLRMLMVLAKLSYSVSLGQEEEQNATCVLPHISLIHIIGYFTTPCITVTLTKC